MLWLLAASASAFVAPLPTQSTPRGVNSPSDPALASPKRPLERPLLDASSTRARFAVWSRRAREPQLRDDPERGWLQEAWAKYVLIRPGMDVDEFKESTKLRTAQGWSWEERTPGTARTLILSVAVVCLFAIPVLVTNPTVFGYLLEFAALSREGVTPAEFWSQLLKRVLEAEQ